MTNNQIKWYQDKFIRKVIVFLCVLAAVGAIASIALVYMEYQQIQRLSNSFLVPLP